MTTGSGDPAPEAAPRRATGLPVESDADERADIEGDRRRQRELDDGELGGEA